MKKCVRPVMKAPMAIRKHPAAINLGLCSLAPKWLTTARNNKLPTSKKEKPRQQKRVFTFLEYPQEYSQTKKNEQKLAQWMNEWMNYIYRSTDWLYPFQNCHLWVQHEYWRGQNVSQSEWWSSSCRFPSEPRKNGRRTAPQWTARKHKIVHIFYNHLHIQSIYFLSIWILKYYPSHRLNDVSQKTPSGPYPHNLNEEIYIYVYFLIEVVEIYDYAPSAMRHLYLLLWPLLTAEASLRLLVLSTSNS